MLLLAHLPFLFERAIERLAGLRGGASVYRCLERLREAGLVEAVRPSLRPGCSPWLYYLTDMGLTVVAIDQGVEPEPMARGNRLRGADLLSLLPGLPPLVASYELLAAIAASRPGRPNLLAWERPWRRRYQRPTSKAPVTVTLPAYTALAWDGVSAAYLLIPDLATRPLRAYRAALDHLLVLRSLAGTAFPALIVATSDERRIAAWGRLLEEVWRARTEAPLVVRVVRWSQLRSGLSGLEGLGWDNRQPPEHLIQRNALRPLKPRRSSSPLWRSVGDAFAPASPATTSDGLGRAALALTAADRALLDMIARHPFLTVDRIAAIFGWGLKWARMRLNRLIDRGLMRLVQAKEIGPEAAALDLAELTAESLALVAAQQGLSLAAAVRYNGLAGGGPDQSIGARRKLLGNLAHTVGANEVFVSLLLTARKLAEAGSDDALVEWRNAAACGQRHLRPDSYGLYRHGGLLYGFFLEYDRGTMSARDYLEKFAAYHAYRATGRFEREYQGFPTILVVTSDNSAEERIARAVRAAAVGRGPALPLLLTCEWRLADARNPCGLLGPVWREPEAAFHDRRVWPLTPASFLGTPNGPRYLHRLADTEPRTGLAFPRRQVAKNTPAQANTQGVPR